MRPLVSIAKTLLAPLFVIGVIAAGIAAFVWWPRDTANQAAEQGAWTCSMHPQIRRDAPGQCPICGMNLIPVSQLGKERDRQAAMGLETESVAFRALVKELRTVGKLDYSENKIAYIAARIDGRVDRVFADVVGTEVKQGDHLVEIYSPKLNVDQASLIQALQEYERRRDRNSEVALKSTRERLRLLGLLPEQIEEIERTRKTSDYLAIYAPMGGTIIEKNVRPGQYVNEGDTLYRIANLDPIWLFMDIYESDLGWIRYGQRVQVRIEAYPSDDFQGTVTLIDPFLDDKTRTIKVRVTLKNAEGRLKPAMYASAVINVVLGPDGKPQPTGLEGKYICPMHPEVIKDEAGHCPICGMSLIRVPLTGAGVSYRSGERVAADVRANEPAQTEHNISDSERADAENVDANAPMSNESKTEVLSVRASAVLDTGERQVVYRKKSDGAFEMVEVHCGPRAIASHGGNVEYFPVLHGLEEGDEVVVRGGFLLDSQRQIEGMPSLLYQEGRSAASLHAGHGGSPAGKPAAGAEHKH